MIVSGVLLFAVPIFKCKKSGKESRMLTTLVGSISEVTSYHSLVLGLQKKG